MYRKAINNSDEISHQEMVMISEDTMVGVREKRFA